MTSKLAKVWKGPFGSKMEAVVATLRGQEPKISSDGETVHYLNYAAYGRWLSATLVEESGGWYIGETEEQLDARLERNDVRRKNANVGPDR